MQNNSNRFEIGFSLFDFFNQYGTEDQCIETLFKWRWPTGFRCPVCGTNKHKNLSPRKWYQCAQCDHQGSLVQGTMFAKSKLPLMTWFLAIYLITHAKSNLPITTLKHLLGLSASSAKSLQQKILHALVEHEQLPLKDVNHRLNLLYWQGERRASRRDLNLNYEIRFISAAALNEKGYPIPQHKVNKNTG